MTVYRPVACYDSLSASSMLQYSLSAPCCQAANYKSLLQPAERQFQLGSASHAAWEETLGLRTKCTSEWAIHDLDVRHKSYDFL